MWVVMRLVEETFLGHDWFNLIYLSNLYKALRKYNSNYKDFGFLNVT